jgi:hypothetical protein
MIDEYEFFSNLVNSIPAHTEWYLQSTSPEFYEEIKGIPFVRETTVIKILFENKYRNQIAGLAKDDLYERINFLEIFQSGKKLLEAFDGFVMVSISKDFNITATALPKYLDMDLLYVSDNW